MTAAEIAARIARLERDLLNPYLDRGMRGELSDELNRLRKGVRC